ncbi:MAG: hypothetical protein IJF36_01655 [Oscillibacter sp.]|nr:hypothetical protein [Oscillibacter sp.]
MQLYLTATPAHRTAALAHTRNLANAAYRIGENSTLLRQNFTGQGGLLSITDSVIPHIPEPEKLCAAVLRECRRRGYHGVVLDFERPPTPDRRSFVRQLEAIRKELALFLPRPYSAEAPTAVVFIGSAISGGDFRTYLQEARQSKQSLALDVRRLRMDFPLPCPGGMGRTLTGEELAQHMPTAAFFSRELCARYFTRTENGQTHFILYDDAETMNRKVRIARELGFTAAFFLWPEIADIASELVWQ